MSYTNFNYIAKSPDANGIVAYTNEENKIWHELITRQVPILSNRACDEFLFGLKELNLSQHRIPQCEEVSSVLRDKTGWSLEPVPALIPFEKFFHLLANKKFPAATFIRSEDELDYLKEPDIFHEIFGHCPLLTHPAYAEFTHAYGKLGLSASPKERKLLAKLYWFTIEFGLIETNHGLRAYGGGILSSKNETIYALESDVPARIPFDISKILNIEYQIDVIQPTYFTIKCFDVLFDLINIDLLKLIRGNLCNI